MAIYRVKVSGSDDNSGLTEALAWATPSKAFATAAAGDIVYFAPGTYRNTSGWTVTNAGSAGNYIQFIGDINCEYFENETPGEVRFTGCNASEVPSRAGTLVTCNKDYVRFKTIKFDGTTNGSNSCISFVNVGTGREVINCIVSGSQYGIYRANLVRGGRISAGYTSCQACQYVDKSLSFGGIYGFESCPLVVNSINIGGQTISRYCMLINCTGYGNYYGFYDGTSVNCMSVGGRHGFGRGLAVNCTAVNTWTAWLGTIWNNGGRAIYCNSVSTGTVTGDTPAQGNHIGFSGYYMEGLTTEILKPTQNFDTGTANSDGYNITGCETAAYNDLFLPCGQYNSKQAYGRKTITATVDYFLYWSTANNRWELATSLGGTAAFYNTDTGATPPLTGWLQAGGAASNTTLAAKTDWPTEDFDGNPRPMGLTSVSDAGAWENSYVEADYVNYNTTPPGIKITGIGRQTFYTNLLASTQYTISVYVEFDTAGDKPQLIVSPLSTGFSTQTDTATGDGTGETLSVTFTPTIDCVARVILYARDVTADKYAIFSDISSSG